MKKANVAAVAVGGFLGGLVAFHVWASIWWLGMIAGALFTGFAFDFAVTHENLAPAFRKTREKMHRYFTQVREDWRATKEEAKPAFSELREIFGEMFGSPQPYFYLPAFVGVSCAGVCNEVLKIAALTDPLGTLVLQLCIIAFGWCIASTVLHSLSELGAWYYMERPKNVNNIHASNIRPYIPDDLFQAKVMAQPGEDPFYVGYGCRDQRVETENTYANIARWTLRGTQQYFIAILWRIPVQYIKAFLRHMLWLTRGAITIIKGLVGVLYSASFYAFVLFLLIVCVKRVLAMTSTALGIAIAYSVLAPLAPAEGARIMASVAAGICAANLFLLLQPLAERMFTRLPIARILFSYHH